MKSISRLSRVRLIIANFISAIASWRARPVPPLPFSCPFGSVQSSTSEYSVLSRRTTRDRARFTCNCRSRVIVTSLDGGRGIPLPIREPVRGSLSRHQNGTSSMVVCKASLKTVSSDQHTRLSVQQGCLFGTLDITTPTEERRHS